MKKFKKISLKDFIALVPTKKDLFYFDIDLHGTAEETQMLKNLCKVEINIKRRFLIWDHILHDINETFYHKEDITAYVSEEVLSFLIANEIGLIGLGHLQLLDEWLLKIYEKDNRCIEALQTVENRRNTNGLETDKTDHKKD